jgi:hypothetical protein
MAVSWEILEKAAECCDRTVKDREGRKQGGRWRRKPEGKQQLGEKISRKRKGYPEDAIFRILILPLDLLPDRNGEIKIGNQSG